MSNIEFALASLGLVLAALGALLVFRFGAPPLRVTEAGARLDVWAGPSTERNKREYDRHVRWSRIGIALLIAGPALQLAALVLMHLS